MKPKKILLKLFKSNFVFGIISIALFIISDLVWLHYTGPCWKLSGHILPYSICVLIITIFHLWVFYKDQKWVATAEIENMVCTERFDLWLWATFGFCYPYFLSTLYVVMVASSCQA